MKLCKWLSDMFSYICCNADSEARADWCPYDGCQDLCEHFEEAGNEEDQHQDCRRKQV